MVGVSEKKKKKKKNVVRSIDRPWVQGLALEGMGEERRLTSTSAAWRRPCGKVVAPCAPSISIALPSIIDDVLGTAIVVVDVLAVRFCREKRLRGLRMKK